MDVYYPNAIFMLCPLIESLVMYWNSLLAKPWNRPSFFRLLGFNLPVLRRLGDRILAFDDRAQGLVRQCS